MNQPVPLLDTHQHLIYPEKFKYSWTDGIPHWRGKAFRYDDYVKLVTGANVAGTIFMETAPDEPHGQAEARLVYQLSSVPGSLIRGVIATCRPENDGLERHIDSLRSPEAGRLSSNSARHAR